MSKDTAEIRPIVEFPGYFVSSEGEFFKQTSKGLETRKSYTGKFGYIYIKLTKEGSYYPKTVHRLVAIAFHGFPTKERSLACHLNDIKTDNSAANIYWGSYSDNMNDAIRNGNRPIGPNCRKKYQPRG